MNFVALKNIEIIQKVGFFVVKETAVGNSEEAPCKAHERAWNWRGAAIRILSMPWI
jgi:hypothetical protein